MAVKVETFKAGKGKTLQNKRVKRTKKSVSSDRNLVSKNQEWEPRTVAKKLGVTVDQVKGAVDKVGHRREDVEKYLTQQPGPDTDDTTDQTQG